MMKTASSPVAGLVLAGGLSSRMGQDKALLALAGRPLIVHVLDRLAPQVGLVSASFNGDAAALAHLGLPLLQDAAPGRPGPLAGVLAGLDWAAGLGLDWLATVPVDTPFVPRDLVARLSSASRPGGGPVLSASGSGLHPAAALWPVRLREDLRQALEQGQRRVAGWALDQGAVTVQFAHEPGSDPFVNLNTPADLAAAEALLRGTGA
ncbi:molybdenum cofactor guanylyltransferase MobA [Frigidibacter mobilis]|uniref:Molybdenum cofactor guanylyltransferase n=1 Tax=Frigidibacter mobilis TaxID=1335048 RepID=A0A159Z0L6_9RHOB|nr:molybdenum cofactor guanylyltransferase MobA [Frigidibacter mobilis]AMY67410.1 molybdopterin-guanine dinucleotide biosynthesis protein MobA [Frigidibacter mobilis]